MRTALFNWLYARQNGGHFLLRIDDTDQERHVESAIQPILDGFAWLGLDIDEGPIFQSSRKGRYAEVVAALYKSGRLYRDYTTPEEREWRQRDHDAKGTGKPYRFRGKQLPDSQIACYEGQKRSFVYRFQVPANRVLTLPDKIRGEVQVNTDEIADFVVARNDGSPLYNLATAVDDHDMAITHVIRAEEHLSNTFPQVLLLEAMGWDAPTFAHIPFVAAPSGKKKLSKRDGPTLGIPVTLAECRELGYIPEAMVNYLARLGWSLDDNSEYFSRDDLIRDFSLEQVGKSPAQYDMKKLFSVQSHWMGQKSTVEKLGMIDIRAEYPHTRVNIHQVVEALGDRMKFAGDVLKYGRSFFQDDLDYEFDPAAFAKRITGFAQGVPILEAYSNIFSRLRNHPEEMDDLEDGSLVVAERHGVKPGDVNHALRIALTGQPVGPGIFDAIRILGPQSCGDRIGRALKLAMEQKLKERIQHEPL